jgi:type I restriction enzyme R subunit
VTDDALRLYADKNAKDTIFLQPYEDYLAVFKEATERLRAIVASPQAVDALIGETAELEFVTMFRELLRAKNVLASFVDFTFQDTEITEQEFEDYKSKYLDIYDKVRVNAEKEKVSILDDVDFELELVRRDDINVDYILGLLAQLVGANDSDRKEIAGKILTTLSGDASLRSKRELIEKFINTTVPKISDPSEVEAVFNEFWSAERTAALQKISEEEGVSTQQLEKLVENYVFTNRKPRKSELAGTLNEKPGILRLNEMVKRISIKFNDYIETFIDNI